MADAEQARLVVGDPVPAAVEAVAREIAAVVRRRQRAALTTLHRALFSAAGEHQLGTGLHVAPTVQGRAVSDRFADVSVGASMVDIGDAVTRGVLPGPPVPGLVEMHVSVAAHHRTLGREVRIPAAEEQGWARAVSARTGRTPLTTPDTPRRFGWSRWRTSPCS